MLSKSCSGHPSSSLLSPPSHFSPRTPSPRVLLLVEGAAATWHCPGLLGPSTLAGHSPGFSGPSASLSFLPALWKVTQGPWEGLEPSQLMPEGSGPKIRCSPFLLWRAPPQLSTGSVSWPNPRLAALALCPWSLASSSIWTLFRTDSPPACPGPLLGTPAQVVPHWITAWAPWSILSFLDLCH